MVGKTYNPKKDSVKQKISISIDLIHHQMVEKAAKEYEVTYSKALNDILEYFKEDFWDPNHKQELKGGDNKTE